MDRVLRADVRREGGQGEEQRGEHGNDQHATRPAPDSEIVGFDRGRPTTAAGAGRSRAGRRCEPQRPTNRSALLAATRGG